MEHADVPPEIDSWLDDLCDRLLDFMISNKKRENSEAVASSTEADTPDKQY